MSKNDGPCKAKTCEHVGKRVLGYCRRHYYYFRTHGIPEAQKYKPKRLPISTAEACWLAAVIDCEGWIGLMRRKSTVHGGFAYWAAIGVGNTNKKLIDRMVELTGVGNVSVVRPKMEAAKDKHTWLISAHSTVRDFLFTIRPHLILKGTQADIIMNMPPKDTKAPEERFHAWQECKRLNKKGRY